MLKPKKILSRLKSFANWLAWFLLGPVALIASLIALAVLP